MYSKLPNLVLGFHGCDKSVYDNVLHEHNDLAKSYNDYDWLGHGIYFWENNPLRAYEWAEELMKRKGSSIKAPAVIGAVIDLGYCLDLSSSESILKLKEQYSLFEREMVIMGKGYLRIKILEKVLIYY